MVDIDNTYRPEATCWALRHSLIYVYTYYMYTPMLKSVLIACLKGWRVHANNHVSIIACSTRVRCREVVRAYRKGVRCIDRVWSRFLFPSPPLFFVFLPCFLGINGKPRLLFRVYIYILTGFLCFPFLGLTVNNVCVVQFPRKSGSSLSLKTERESVFWTTATFSTEINST